MLVPRYCLLCGEIAGTGSRSGIVSAKVRVIEPDFKVDDKMMADFKALL